MAKILLVEDDPSLADLFQLALRRGDFLVLHVDNGKDALRWVNEELNPDLIIMDVGLPDMSGIDATKQIKANYKTREIPVIILTAFTDNKVKMDANFEGAADLFLNKPIDTGDLIDAARRLIEKSSREKKLRRLRY